MPLHTFEAPDGSTVERIVKHGTNRITVNGVKHTRLAVPESFAMPGSAVGMAPQKEQVREGYYQLECDKGSRFNSKYSKKKIKQAWGI